MRTDGGEVNLSRFDYIIVHVGTNNVDRRHSYDDIITDYGNLIPIIKKKIRSIRIIISAILPRPEDHDDTDSMLKKGLKKCLHTKMGPDLDFDFVETWKAVSKCGTFSKYLYVKNTKVCT